MALLLFYSPIFALINSGVSSGFIRRTLPSSLGHFPLYFYPGYSGIIVRCFPFLLFRSSPTVYARPCRNYTSFFFSQFFPLLFGFSFPRILCLTRRCSGAWIIVERVSSLCHEAVSLLGLFLSLWTRRVTSTTPLLLARVLRWIFLYPGFFDTIALYGWINSFEGVAGRLGGLTVGGSNGNEGSTRCRDNLEILFLCRGWKATFWCSIIFRGCGCFWGNLNYSGIGETS